MALLDGAAMLRRRKIQKFFFINDLDLTPSPLAGEGWGERVERLHIKALSYRSHAGVRERSQEIDT